MVSSVDGAVSALSNTRQKIIRRRWRTSSSSILFVAVIGSISLCIVSASLAATQSSVSSSSSSSSSQTGKEQNPTGNAREQIRSLQQWGITNPNKTTTIRTPTATTPVSKPSSLPTDSTAGPTALSQSVVTPHWTPVAIPSVQVPASTGNETTLQYPENITLSDSPVSDAPVSYAPTSRPRTRRPVPTPTTNLPTSNSPVAEPTDEPIAKPSVNPTDEPTSDFPSTEPTPLDVFEGDGNDSNTSTQVIKFDPINITFYLEAPKEIDLDLTEVEQIAAHHLFRQSQIISATMSNTSYTADDESTSNTDIILVQEVTNVTVVPMSVDTSFLSMNNTVLQTYLITGTILVNAGAEDESSNITSVVNRMVLDSFRSDEGKVEFVALLRVSKDSSIRRIYDVGTTHSFAVTPELPPPANASQAQGESNDSTTNGDDSDHQGHVMRLAVIIVGAASAFALLLVVVILLYSSKEQLSAMKCCCSKKANNDSNKSTTIKEDPTQQTQMKPSIPDNRTSSSTNKINESKILQNSTSGNAIQPIVSENLSGVTTAASTKAPQMRRDSRKTDTVTGPPSKRILLRPTQGSNRRMSKPNLMSGKNRYQPYDDDVDVDDSIAHAMRTVNIERDTSEISSVYSYLETHSNFVDMIQDEAYSIGNVNGIDVDDDGNTRNGTWSVFADEHMSMIEGTQHNQRSVATGASVSTYGGTSLFGSPSKGIPSFVGKFLSSYNRSSDPAQSSSQTPSGPIDPRASTTRNETLEQTPSKMIIVTKAPRPKPVEEVSTMTTKTKASSSKSSIEGKASTQTEKYISNINKILESDASETVEIKVITGGRVEQDTESSTSTGSDEQEIVRATVAERRIAATAVSFGNKYKTRQQQKEVLIPQKSRTSTTSRVIADAGKSMTTNPPLVSLPTTTSSSHFNALLSSRLNAEHDPSDSDIHSVDGDQSLFSSISKLTHETGPVGPLFSMNFQAPNNLNHTTQKPNYESDAGDDDKSDSGMAEKIMLPAKYNMGVRMIDTGRNRYFSDTDDDLSSTGGSIATRPTTDGQATYGYHGYNRDRPFNDLASF